MLLGLAMYLNLAGPLGRGIEKLVGWFSGLGRFVVPVLLIAVGVALVHKGRSSSPFRLVLGWGLMALSTLGLLHVVRGPDKFSAGFDELGEAGGWLGALVAEPLRALLASAGAVVVMLAAFVGGAAADHADLVADDGDAHRSRRGLGGQPLGAPHARRSPTCRRSAASKADRRAGARRQRAWPASRRRSLRPTSTTAAEDGDPWARSGRPAAKPRKRRGRSTAPGADRRTATADRRHAAWASGCCRRSSFLKQAGQQAVNMAEIERRGQTLQESLEPHGVETALVGMTVGPTVTRYELELGAGVKVARVTTLQKDIAYAMAAIDVRILAPIPGRSAIGVEVPNHQRQLVALGDLMVSPEATKATDPLEVAIGKDIAGRAVFLDLATTPHLLIAGATGAGKSSGLNCIITSLLMRTTPDQVRLILIDPKQVEMGQYQRLPHLLTQPVTNPKKAANALGWAVKEMDRRYDVLSEVGFRDITGYNAAFDRGEVEAEPHRDAAVRAPAVHRGRRRRAQRPDDGRRPRRRGLDHAHRPEGAGGRHPPDRRHAASVGERDHRCHQGQHPGSHGVRRLVAHRLAGHPRPARRREARRQGRHAAAARQLLGAQRIQGAFVSEEEVRKVVAHWRRQAPDVSYSNDVEGGDRRATATTWLTSSANAFSSGRTTTRTR